MSVNTVFVQFSGYAGDAMYADPKKAVQDLVGDARVAAFSIEYFLTQLGHGHGYFNNSGRYTAMFKVSSKTQTVEEIKAKFDKMFDVAFYDTEAAFVAGRKETHAAIRQLRKQVPY